MKSTLPGLSGKIDANIVSALKAVNEVSASMHIPFFVVGATARDILLSIDQGIESKRATLDVDIAVFVENWKQFEDLKTKLVNTHLFSKTRDTQRILFKKQFPVDIIPFGKIAGSDGFIHWPPDNSFKMSVEGFSECYQHSVRVKIDDEPELVVNVVNLAGLTILKLIAWHENSDRRRKDAADLVFIVKNYLSAGNVERLFDQEVDIVDLSNNDYEVGSALLLGRDVSHVGSENTIKKIKAILKEETQRDQGHRIAMDACQDQLLSKDPYERIVTLFDSLYQGMESKL